MSFKHKFGAVRCERDALKFPSKLERAVYDQLKMLENAEKVRMVLRQIPFDLPGGTKHFVDYCVFTPQNVLFIEAKGRDLEPGRLKRKLVESLYSLDIHVVKTIGQLHEVLEKHGR